MQDGGGKVEWKAADKKDESARMLEGGKYMPLTIATTGFERGGVPGNVMAAPPAGEVRTLVERAIRMRGGEEKAAATEDVGKTGSGTEGKKNSVSAMAGGEIEGQLGGGEGALMSAREERQQEWRMW